MKYFLFGAQFHIWDYVRLLLQVRCGCTGVDVGKDCKGLFLFSLSRKIKIEEIFDLKLFMEKTYTFYIL